MADGKKVVEMPEQKKPEIETKDLNAKCVTELLNLQRAVNIDVSIRDKFITGVGAAMDLDNSWRFDFDGFLKGNSCRFVRRAEKQEATENK